MDMTIKNTFPHFQKPLKEKVTAASWGHLGYSLQLSVPQLCGTPESLETCKSQVLLLRVRSRCPTTGPGVHSSEGISSGQTGWTIPLPIGVDRAKPWLWGGWAAEGS